MKLTVAERVNFPSILPVKGSYLAMSIKSEIIEKIRLTPSEIVEWEITEINGGIRWNPDKSVDVDISFTAPEIDVIRMRLSELDKSGEITDATVGLYRKIMT